jgi:hypothetical protein
MSFWCHRLDHNSNKNIVMISALKYFVASWGLPGSFLGLAGDLLGNIINKEAYRKPQKASRKPMEAIKTFRAEILTIFLLLFWTKRCHQKDISKLTDIAQYGNGVPAMFTS